MPASGLCSIIFSTTSLWLGANRFASVPGAAKQYRFDPAGNVGVVDARTALMLSELTQAPALGHPRLCGSARPHKFSRGHYQARLFLLLFLLFGENRA